MRFTNNWLIRSKDQRLFLKIFSYFLSLLIPIVVVGLATYLYSVDIMKRDFNERIRTNLQNAANTIDVNLEAAQETSLNFFNDDMVRMLLMPKEQQSLEVRSEIWRLPKIIQRNENIVSDFTDRLFVYIDNKDIYVSGGVNRFDSFFGNMYKYGKYDAEFWTKRLSSTDYIELLPVSSVSQEGIHDKQVVPIVFMNRINNRTAIMVLNIAVEALARTLKGSTVFDSTGFLITDANGETLYDTNRFMTEPKVTELLASHPFSESGGGQVEFQGGKYEISHAQSGLFGWHYYSFTPSGEFNRHTFSILSMTLILCIVLVVMGVVFSLIFSLRIYNPIRNIRNIITDQSELLRHDDHPAEKNEFEQIQQGIRRLTDHHLKYKLKYDKHTNEYVESSFLFLLKGHTLNQEEILRDTLATEFGFSRSGYVCCAVHFDLKEAFYQHIQDTDRLYVMNGVKKILWTLLGAKVPSYVLEYRQNLFVGIVNIEHPNEAEQLHGAFRQMLDIFRYDIHMYYDITIGIGSFYTGINEIGSSYNEAMTAIGKRNGEERFQVVDSNELQIENRFVYSFFDEQKILNHLKLGDQAGVESIVKEIVDSNVSRSISYEYLLLLFKELYMTGVRFLVERGIDVNQLDSGETRETLTDAHRGDSFIGASQLQEALHSFYRSIVEATKPESGLKSGNLVSLIEKYIQENYTKDLGLEQISGEMGVSVKYVSRVFKEKTGTNLTDYITQVRLEKAKELLIQTDMRVNDIAEQTGIPSRTTFLRVFKKAEGVAPNEYRTIHRQQP
ncbi:helix-turn-helix domain-containing protein [Paenibacillus silviterrae]|uniref:helix-turn-helix domain-containing protein n=1 Tax=Paenibacillus silviterrae TaxID=3242194 RepID=UPI002543CECE|nr:helix-turn-helix domain-containing protein [Paenibacillus chinjuensis]